MKKLVSIVCCLLMIVSLVGCGEKEDTVKVGVVQLAEHPALNAATKGFNDELKRLMPEVEIIEKNANGEISACSTIVDGFITKKVDLIMANATPALQAASAKTESIPILGTSVTEYGVALGIEDDDGEDSEDDTPRADNADKPVKKYNRNKVKYTCPDCQSKVWGKAGLHIECVDCACSFEEEEHEEDSEGLPF